MGEKDEVNEIFFKQENIRVLSNKIFDKDNIGRV